MWESFQAGNLRTLDFGFWKELESPVAKRLYRLLDKRFYRRRQVSFPLATLAYDKVGISQDHTGQIKETLRKGHAELEGSGFCRSDFVRTGRGVWEVVYTDLRSSARGEATKTQLADPLGQALAERGIKNSAELLRKQPSRERVEQAIENYDDRLANGERLTHRWLASNILHASGYDFRPGFKSKARRQEEAAAREEKSKAEHARSVRQEAARQKSEQASREACRRFLNALETDAAREEFYAAALAAYPFYLEFYQDCLEHGDMEKAARHRGDAALLYWKNTEASSCRSASAQAIAKST